MNVLDASIGTGKQPDIHASRDGRRNLKSRALDLRDTVQDIS
jgi:hypothetical protein